MKIIVKKLPILICFLITYFALKAKEQQADHAVEMLQVPTPERAQLTNDQDIQSDKDKEWSTIRYYFFVRSTPVPTMSERQLNILANYGE
ncbi:MULTISPECIES: hypothetical protein [Olivibacter]|uniref:Uncharacterized protein n=1 Tax=Olivibacter jilunii TaxID=985016 RepID=A0ABW6B4V9_9SPHI|nr:hypothetical protein [Pseudosphingobacterium sp.]